MDWVAGLVGGIAGAFSGFGGSWLIKRREYKEHQLKCFYGPLYYSLIGIQNRFQGMENTETLTIGQPSLYYWEIEDIKNKNSAVYDKIQDNLLFAEEKDMTMLAEFHQYYNVINRIYWKFPASKGLQNADDLTNQYLFLAHVEKEFNEAKEFYSKFHEQIKKQYDEKHEAMVSEGFWVSFKRWRK